MKILKSILIQLIIVVIFFGAMFALNFLTGPIIQANNAGAQFAPLLAVMPEGASFSGESCIYDSENAGESTLKDVPKSVKSVYQEANGLGYAIRVTAESSYSTAPMQITIGIAADGKICGIQIDSYNDTASFDFRVKDPNYLPSYIGKDSALADIGTVTGSTYSSTAFKNAVSEAMGVLISNEMIQAGQKSDEQILTELMTTLATGYVKPTEIEISGNIKKAFKASNGAGFAYVVEEGEAKYLALVNATGVCKVFNVEGVEVTADHSAIVTEAKTHASANQTSFYDGFVTKLGRMMTGATNFVAVEVETFNTVVSAVKFNVEGTEYYGLYSRSFGFSQMDVYYVIDANGAIAKVDAKQLIFEEEYFMNFAGIPNGYYNGFVGLTQGTWTDDVAIIATATRTSEAMKQSTNDVFNAFDSIQKGGQQ